VVVPPYYFVGTMQLQVRATSTEQGNGSTASVTRDITVQVLSGTACSTPLCLNPFVTYFNDTTSTVDSETSTMVVASPLVPYGASSAFIDPLFTEVAPLQLAVDDGDESMEEWLQRMSQSLGSAFQAEVAEMIGNGG
jgi:hypothetical protein